MIASENFFTTALHLERKRTERSRNRFVLMLVTGPSLQQSSSILACSIRETDIIGWYKDGEVVGVIFTEIGDGEVESLIGALRARVTTLLSRVLTNQQMEETALLFHMFPEKWNEHGQHPADLAALYPDLERDEKQSRYTHFAKRMLDIVGSLSALIFFSPLFLAIAIAVRLTSAGPVLFHQERVGQCGRRFTFLKFRSMYYRNDHAIHEEFVTRFISGNSESSTSTEGNSRIFKLTVDPRITPIGRILRKTSLDEMPQFWNVLRGEMSLVGPRPPVPYEYEAYATWHRRRLLEAKPGITGLWQVEGRSRLTFAEMVRLDLKYARTWSLWLDLKILLRTPSAVLSGEGAH